MNLDFEVCDGKTFRDLCQDIVDRSQSKKDQIDSIFSELRGHIKNPADIQAFLPLIKDFLEVGIKNDEQLIKLTGIIQKLQSTQLEATGGESGLLSEEDKEKILKNSIEQISIINKQVNAPLEVSSSL